MSLGLHALILNARAMIQGRKLVLVSGFWSLVLRIAGLVSGFATGVLLARILGPVEFGIYGLATTIASLAMSVTQMGTPQLAVRELSIRSERSDWSGVKAFILAFARATAIASLAIGALSLVVANAAGVTSQQLQIVIQASILASLTAFTGLFAAELRGLGALLKGQSMDIMVRPMVTFVIIGALLLGGARLDALLALMIQNAVTLAAVVVSGIWLWRSIPPQFRRDPPARLHPWIGVALPLAAVDVLRVLDGSCSLVIVSWLSSASDLGVFRVAVACGVLAAMPVTIFHILLAPTLSRLHAVRSTQQMQSVLTWAAASMTAITLVVSVAAWFLGKSAISLVFGPVYAGAWLPLFILTLVQFVYAVFGMGPILLAMCGGERALIRIYAIAVGCSVLVAIPMTMIWGGAGAATGPLASAVLIGWMCRRHARRQLGVEISAVRLLSSSPPGQ